MAAALIKTRTPGIYKRGGRYVAVYRDGVGAQHRESARTYDEARELKRKRDGQAAAGEQAGARLADYALEWIDRYQGRGGQGFRESTRDSYRADLTRYVLPFLDPQGRRRVVQITPRDVARLIGWLCDEQAQGERGAEERRQQLTAAGKLEGAAAVKAQPVYLADQTVRRIVAPLRSCLRDAMREGLISHNPTQGLALPARDAIRAVDQGVDDEPDRRALTRPELASLLGIVPDRHRTLVRLLASCGLRISEGLALQWRNVRLDGSRPCVQVRRAYVKGRYGPPKSRYGRREVPLDHVLVRELRQARAESDWPGDDDLVFCSPDGRPLHDRNLSTRMLKPAAEEAGVPWMGWHTLRHTCASLLFERGANAVQVQRWLGHHSPAFTLATYVHLLADDLGEPLDLGAELRQGDNKVTTGHPETAANRPGPSSVEYAA
jgi:integrase